MNSSGTSGKSLSKIYLDKINSSNQVKTLKNIVQSEIGDKRLPMLIVDSDPREIKKNILKLTLDWQQLMASLFLEKITLTF